MLKAAQSWSVEKNVASFLLELLRSLNTFIDGWIDFFKANALATFNIQFPNTDFFTEFVQPAVGNPIRDKLA